MNVMRLNRKKLRDIRLSLFDRAPFFSKDDETFLKRYTLSEWSEYELWLYRNRLFTISGLKTLYNQMESFKIKPKISIIMPVYNPEPVEFMQALESVLWQVYPYWELCIVDDCSDNREYLNYLKQVKDKRVKMFIREVHTGIADTSTYAINKTCGDYIAELDQDDELHPDSLFAFVQALQFGEIDFFYSDKDIISPEGKRYMHFFKPDWSPEYLLSFNYISHFEIFSRSIISLVGGYRTDYEGSQDYDLILRVSEKTAKIHHCPMILYSWRQSKNSIAIRPELKEYTFEAGVKTLRDALKRRGLPVNEITEDTNLWRGQYRIGWDYDILKERKTFFIAIGENKRETDRITALFKHFTAPFNVKFLTSDFIIENIDNLLKGMEGEGFVFFCDDRITEIISFGLTDMLGYLSIEDVSVTGCRFLDRSDKIFNAGLSVTGNGKVLFSYEGSPADVHGYGATAAAARNVAAVFPAFWGCKISELRERGYLNNLGGGYYHGVLNFFIDILNIGKRIAYVPHMSLRIDKERLDYNDALQTFIDRWKKEHMSDPYYNPNLTDIYTDFGLKV